MPRESRARPSGAPPGAEELIRAAPTPGVVRQRRHQERREAALAKHALQRMVFKKARQVDRVIRDLRDGAATIPGVDVDQLERVWPIIVTAGGTLFQRTCSGIASMRVSEVDPEECVRADQVVMDAVAGEAVVGVDADRGRRGCWRARFRPCPRSDRSRARRRSGRPCENLQRLLPGVEAGGEGGRRSLGRLPHAPAYLRDDPLTRPARFRP
jgi:hypothetical protein